ncbi:MAG: DNA polymerase II [bacterium]|nr:DNA polymerase II [bacterium]
MSHTGFILHPGQRIASTREFATSAKRTGRVPVIQLFGRLSGGEVFLIEETRFRPYFFVHEEAAHLLEREHDVTLEATELRSLSGRALTRVVARMPGEIPRLRERIESMGQQAYEADIRFPYRFLCDRGVGVGVEIAGEPEILAGGLLRFLNPEIRAADVQPELSVLSIDIETTSDASRVHSVALVGAGADEVLIVSDTPVEAAVVCSDEAELLSRAAESVRRIDPDVITGWNVVDFDLRVLATRARAKHIRFDVGRIPGPIDLQRDGSYTRQSRADIPGRIVLDGMNLVRDAFISLEDFSLETAARTLLGRGKLIQPHDGDRGAEIQRQYREERDAFVEYNREDAKLVLDILEQEALLDLAIERSRLCGMQLDRVGASIASFDRLYLPRLRAHGYVAPSVDRERKSARVQGGAVMDSQAGLYENVAVYDFRSLYPSLMRTFNLDPLAHAQPGERPIRAPNGAAFSRTEAILPEILEGFLKRRARAKRRGDRHADLAIKIMMNALFGVMGAASCRFFDPAVANAITGFGQDMLARTRRLFEDEGVRVLYGDTDSVFVALSEKANPEIVRKQAESLLERTQAQLSAQIREQYDVEPRFELELERIYSRFFMPTVRGGKQGSKKRYAGLVDDELRVVGLEAVRRDWPAVARRLQLGILERVFRDQSAIPFVREIVRQVRAGELDRELVIRKGLRKGSVERYTARTAPHVEAARRAGGRVGRVVRYVITRSGPEPVLPGLEFPKDPDREHYVEKVLRPLADAILPFVGGNFDEAIGAPHQLELL